MFAVLEDVQFIQDLAWVLIAAGLFGWLARSLGLSSIVGYLIGGLCLSPHNAPIPVIEDTGRIHTLAQIGLIFLLFHIGLDFSIRRLRRLGFHLILANIVAAIVIFNTFQFVGVWFGWDDASRIFLASMFLISSSAIINKVLRELGISHEKPSQMAMGLVIIEDALVVILLALLTAYVQFDEGVATPIASTVGVLGTFILLLLLLGFFLVPRFLRLVRKQTNPEITVIVVCALIFSISVISVKAGYSLALGAFLFGAVIADTPAKIQLERWLSGAQSILTAIFFTAIGMLINVALIPSVWRYILIISAFVLLFRFLGYTVGLLLTGTSFSHSVRTGLTVTPVGEFSFVIAGVGIESGAIPDRFYPIAIGVCFITSFISPFLIRYSEGITESLEKFQPSTFRSVLRNYRGLLDRLTAVRNQSLVWKLSQKRVLQILRELGLITGIVLFSKPLYRGAVERFGNDLLFETGTLTLSLVLGLVISSAPLLSLWRNLSALSLVYAEIITPRQTVTTPVARRFATILFNVIFFLFIIGWIWSLVPLEALTIGGLFLVITVLVCLFIGLRRPLIRLQSNFEVSLEESIGTRLIRNDQKLNYLLDPHRDWNLEIIECEIPDDSPHAGKLLKDLGIRRKFGASLVGIDRQGFIIGNPTAENTLYPGDRILLLGTLEQVKATRNFLAEREFKESKTNFDDITLDQIQVPQSC
ncbi:MAG: cation:proton antiporter, partial [Verrucomicrobiota bacterium]